MKKKLVLFWILLICGGAFAQNYSVYDFDNYPNKNFGNEKILFIADYSSSMSEPLEGESKVNIMLDTVEKILPTLSKDKFIGLRVYGHRRGLTAYDACKASTLAVPVMQNSTKKIEREMNRFKPSGMTPITYSLKQAVEKDLNFEGDKKIVLLTDGGENCDESPCKWAMKFIKTRKDVKIDVIAFNMDNYEDIDQLRCVANVTSGKLYNAETSAQLLNSLQKSFDVRKEVDAKIIPHH